jgi:hypothetical protein
MHIFGSQPDVRVPAIRDYALLHLAAIEAF